MIQLYNKITNIKKVLKLRDNMANTHQLRQKLQQHSEVPDNNIEAYVPYFNIKDDVDKPEDTMFLAIFATKRTLSLLSKSDIQRPRILLKSKLHQISKQCFQMLQKSGLFQAASVPIMTNP